MAVQSLPSSNSKMVEELILSSSLWSPECIQAFSAVDRQHFWLDGLGDLVYADMPLKSGRFHLSAPQIYAEALESMMPLQPGMSFLNIGSGTGYFNCIVSELLGEDSTNHGIDIWKEVVEYSESRSISLGKSGISYVLGNVYELDVNKSMRYDRIYLGACANSRSKYLYGLLEVGGILVGPFQAGRTQQLRRVVRQSEKYFSVEILESVRFAPLVEPTPTSGQDSASPPQYPSLLQQATESVGFPAREHIELPKNEGGKAMGLPGVPFTFRLCEVPWSEERSSLFPSSFRLSQHACILSSNRQSLLPNEMWTQHIFPWCPKWWFDPDHPSNIADSQQGAHMPIKLQLPIPAPLPTCELERDEDQCCGRTRRADSADEGAASTRASSSSFSESSPTSSPQSPDNFSSAFGPQRGSRALVEVFGNGQQYAIGSAGDPDDLDADVRSQGGPRDLYPLHVLRVLLEAHQRPQTIVASPREATQQQGNLAGVHAGETAELVPDRDGEGDITIEILDGETGHEVGLALQGRDDVDFVDEDARPWRFVPPSR
mmetsp:Transcript_72382/g.172479  ORF Transcript_72382/g.172479 Transcript_72382/m.172479 type:complete len:545 (+) Transcript_72382:102-1736(+)